VLYEDLNEKEYAQKLMKDAARRGSAEANSQLSRSLILNNQPQEALKFIARCLEHTEYDGVKALVLKIAAGRGLNKSNMTLLKQI
jgi:hypothetical protein